MPLWYPRDGWDIRPEPTLVRSFRLLIETDSGDWDCIASESENFQRLVRMPIDISAQAIRLVIDSTWGNDVAEVFAWEVI